MILFQYDQPILDKFPTLRGGIIYARHLTNGPTPDALKAAYTAEQQATIARVSATPLSEITSLAAWRRVFSAFGVQPTKYRNAAEALLRRLTKKGDIPNLNMLVDLGNLVSIRYGLPVAFVNRAHMTGTLTVHFASGDERFTDLGQTEILHPEPGEVVFSDETRIVFARRWCWRQGDQGATREDTTEALITIEGVHNNAEADVQAARDNVLALLREHVPGVELHSALLKPGTPALTLD
ncbi:MAG: hypothetical protein K8S97_14755 [Anaerolineae bacterium]|nr:hypothetical protein [Anaerolineae bacterium]